MFAGARVKDRRTNDRLGIFISECLEPDANSDLKAKDAYGVYYEWCRENNFHAENKMNFIAGLRGKNMITYQKRVNGIPCNNVIERYRFADDYITHENNENTDGEPPF